MNLYDLNKGEKARITSINLTGVLLKRVLEMGIIESSKIQVIALAPQKSTILIYIDGDLLGIDSELCKKIEVVKCKK